MALLVEDETLVAMVSEDSLRALGFEAICVETAAGALSALKDGAHEVALAVIDIGLPDMRGDDLIARIRETLPGLPIVMASGYDAAALRLRFAGDPALASLGKPYSEYDLKQAIASLGLTTE